MASQVDKYAQTTPTVAKSRDDLELEIVTSNGTMDTRILDPSADSDKPAPTCREPAMECLIRDENRETWGKKVDYLLSTIGYAVDLANIWRFPYLCYKNGGGAFLLPYFTMMLFGAVPLFYMELILGQFNQTGAISVWQIVPMFKGIGYSVCMIAWLVSLYYNVIIGWSFYYLFSSFTLTLPWTHCQNSWNSVHCYDDASRELENSTTGSYHLINNSSFKRVSAAAEFFERRVLGLHESNGMDDLGQPRWMLVLCTVLVFFIIYFALWKGVKTSGKVVWVTATLPYIVLSILLVRGCVLPGAGKGVKYFITPNIHKLANPQVWIDAAVQIFYSVGAGFGVHIAYSSYNKFNNNCYRDCLVTALVNCFTSIFSGFVIFCYLGYMSEKQNIALDKVAKEGPGLVFVVYPEAIATLPGSAFWSIIFFLMLITLGIDSAMGGLESVVTGVKDEFRDLFSRHAYSRETFVAIMILCSFLCSILSLTEGGMFVFTLLDTFSAGTSILFGVFSQSVAVSWFYGLSKLGRDAELMIGSKPGIYWRVCWKIISPLFLAIIIVSSIVSFRGLQYEMNTRLYVYPNWANLLGWTMSLCSMLCIPLVALYKIYTTRGPLSTRLAICISPVWEHEAIRKGGPVRRYKKDHWLTFG